MVAFNYNKASLKGKALIEKFGASGSFIIKGNTGGYDDDGNVIDDTADVTIRGIVTPLLDYDTQTMRGVAESRDTTIKSGDKYCFFDSNTDVPLGAIISINGGIWRSISNVSLKSVSGVSVYQKIQLRK